MSFLNISRKSTNPAEPFVRLHPKDNFYQSTSFFPMPFAMITTVDENGTTSIGPHSLTFPFDLIEEPSMMLVSRASSNTSTNLRRGSKAALCFVEWHKPWLQEIVNLGYPGQTPEEKMAKTCFELEKSPSPEYQDDPEFPLIMKDAFQVYECEINGEFEWKPHRETDEDSRENFWNLSVKNILLRESFERKLVEQKEFPHIPISFGFRHNENERRFFFASHSKPFPVHIPVSDAKAAQSIWYDANKMDPDVRFTQESCVALADIPKPFRKLALKGIIKAAKEEGVTMVDEDFVAKVNAERNQ